MSMSPWPSMRPGTPFSACSQASSTSRGRSVNLKRSQRITAIRKPTPDLRLSSSEVKVLFVCQQNAGRSQMSEALFLRAAGGSHEAQSAGTEPARQVHPEVIEVMRELGVDLAGRQPRRLTDELA